MIKVVNDKAGCSVQSNQCCRLMWQPATAVALCAALAALSGCAAAEDIVFIAGAKGCG